MPTPITQSQWYESRTQTVSELRRLAINLDELYRNSLKVQTVRSVLGIPSSIAALASTAITGWIWVVYTGVKVVGFFVGSYYDYKFNWVLEDVQKVLQNDENITLRMINTDTYGKTAWVFDNVVGNAGTALQCLEYVVPKDTWSPFGKTLHGVSIAFSTYEIMHNLSLLLDNQHHSCVATIVSRIADDLERQMHEFDSVTWDCYAMDLLVENRTWDSKLGVNYRGWK